MRNRLVKSRLIDLLDPAPEMMRMTAMPTSLDLRPPADPLMALMDDLTLDMLLGNDATGWPGRGRAEVLTADDQARGATGRRAGPIYPTGCCYPRW